MEITIIQILHHAMHAMHAMHGTLKYWQAEKV